MSQRKLRGAKPVQRPESSRSQKTAAKPRQRGANTASVSLIGRLLSWLSNHRNSCFLTLSRLLRQFMSSLLTWLVIGIAMALPVGLYVFLSNVENVAGGWNGNAKISVYLHNSVQQAEVLQLQTKLLRKLEVDEVIYLSSDEALAEFEQISGFGDILQSLPNNPLPPLLEVSLQGGASDIDVINRLVADIETQRIVDTVQLDLHWVQRLQAILELAQQLVIVLGVLLGMAVLLVTGNTIRLAIESRRDEIVIIKLVGGTDAYVRRPLLYTGFWYGVGGAIVAMFIVQLSMLLLSQPAAVLFGLYDFRFDIEYLSANQALVLLGGGAALGLVGAWVSVSQHLQKIQPK